MTRVSSTPRVEDFLVIGDDLERIVRVREGRGRQKGKKVVVTIKRTVPTSRLSFVRKVSSKFFFSVIKS